MGGGECIRRMYLTRVPVLAESQLMLREDQKMELKAKRRSEVERGGTWKEKEEGRWGEVPRKMKCLDRRDGS